MMEMGFSGIENLNNLETNEDWRLISIVKYTRIMILSAYQSQLDLNIEVDQQIRFLKIPVWISEYTPGIIAQIFDHFGFK